jgi:hypothetical protein
MCYLQLVAVRGDCAALSSILDSTVLVLPAGCALERSDPSDHFDICLTGSSFLLLERLSGFVGQQLRIQGAASQVSTEPSGLILFKGTHKGRETEYFALIRPGETLPSPRQPAKNCR